MFGISALDTEARDIETDIAIGPNAGGTIVSDRTLTLAPEVTVNGLARYEWPFFNGTMSAEADFS